MRRLFFIFVTVIGVLQIPIQYINTKNKKKTIYGLCEINREDIKKARLIANPGCYPTCSTLSIYPMAKEGLIEMNSVIIEAKS